MLKIWMNGCLEHSKGALGQNAQLRQLLRCHALAPRILWSIFKTREGLPSPSSGVQQGMHFYWDALTFGEFVWSNCPQEVSIPVEMKSEFWAKFTGKCCIESAKLVHVFFNISCLELLCSIRVKKWSCFLLFNTNITMPLDIPKPAGTQSCARNQNHQSSPDYHWIINEISRMQKICLSP